MTESVQLMEVQGGCHCGAVRYRARVPSACRVQRCNCSMCQRLGYLHLIIPRRDFELLQGEAGLTEYCFNTGVARHWFCSSCGVKAFYRPRSNPDGISLNVRCIDEDCLPEMTVEDFDGQNWEQHGDSLEDLSK